MTDIKPIETRYAGCHFRSRLEARWAVFFDHLRIAWEYEPQGFDVNGTKYLPDFLLTATDTWVEVKGSEQAFHASAATYADAIDFGGRLPGVADCLGSTSGLLVLGPHPRIDHTSGQLFHTLLQHSKGVLRSFASFRADGGFDVIPGFHSSTAPDLPDPEDIPYTSTAEDRAKRVDPVVLGAYTAARSARFEHQAAAAADVIPRLRDVLAECDLAEVAGRVEAIRRAMPIIRTVADDQLRHDLARQFAVDSRNAKGLISPTHWADR